MLAEHAFAIRPDLVWREIRMGPERCWVAHDPLSGRYFHFDEQEMAIIGSLDGRQQLSLISAEWSRMFAPQVLPVSALARFLGKLAQDGLLQGGLGKPSSTADSGRTFWKGQSWLAFRLPGINPDFLLSQLAPLTRWMFTRTFAVFCVGWLLMGLMLGIVHFEEFQRSLPTLRDWMSPDVFWATMTALVLTKTLHEVAHALTATQLGARCESMGVMLLMGVPVLYSDVSRAWLLPRRRDRLLVSAAGMLAELIVAVATLVLWTWASDPATRLVLASVIIVSSVNTMLVNGNPLLRYDGYYLFSDLVGIPNLAEESRAEWRSQLRRWLQPGLPAFPDTQPAGRRILLRTYGILSLAYRTLLGIAFAYSAYVWGHAQQLPGVGSALSLLILAALIVMPAVRWVNAELQAAAAPHARLRRRKSSWKAAAIAILVLAIIANLPLPRRVDAPFRIELQSSHLVQASLAGELVDALPAGASVQAGDVVAVLRNPEQERELAKAENLIASLTAQREALVARRAGLQQSDELPALTQRLAAARDSAEVLRMRLGELTLRATAAGVVTPPPNIRPEPLGEHDRRQWTGTPLDVQNRNAWMTPGTVIAEIAPPGSVVAVLHVSQQDVQSLQPGQSVRLWISDGVRTSLTGEVIQINAAPLAEAPRELAARELIAVRRQSTNPLQPAAPHYQVTVRLDESEQSIPPLRITGRASIRASWSSAWQQISAEVFERLNL